MFTGLVQDLGTVTAVDATARRRDAGVRTRLAGEIAEGDSVAVNGVCLTATAIADGEFRAEVMHETLRRSSLAEAAAGSGVNLELSLRASDRLGGHIVQGHVDGLGAVRDVARGRLRPRRDDRRAARAAALRGREGLDRRQRRLAHRRRGRARTGSPSR